MIILRSLTLALSILAQPRGTHAAVSAVSCPQDVESAGENSRNWTFYNDWDQFLPCNEKLRLITLGASNAHDANDSLPSGSPGSSPVSPSGVALWRLLRFLGMKPCQ